MPNITAFDPREHHLRLVGRMKSADGLDYEYRSILDTGAPSTEFSDQFLAAIGLLSEIVPPPSIMPGLQTQKYAKLTLPRIEICGHIIEAIPVFVSHFENHWGVDALIGLDFFRRFRVTIDYQAGHVVTEQYG